MLVMDTCADFARMIEALPERNRSGTLQVWGEWFGRPMDNVHTCKSCEAGPAQIILHFDQGERLSIWNPIQVQTRGFTLLIAKASRVRWEWYYYGRPQSPENLLFLDYTLKGEKVLRTSNQPWDIPNSARASANAVELVGM